MQIQARILELHPGIQRNWAGDRWEQNAFSSGNQVSRNQPNLWGPRRTRSRSRAYRKNILPYWKYLLHMLFVIPDLRAIELNSVYEWPRYVKLVSVWCFLADCSWYSFSYSIVTKSAVKDCIQWDILTFSSAGSFSTTKLFTKPSYNVKRE